jgi:hypothetical protein
VTLGNSYAERIRMSWVASVPGLGVYLVSVASSRLTLSFPEEDSRLWLAFLTVPCRY